MNVSSTYSYTQNPQIRSILVLFCHLFLIIVSLTTECWNVWLLRNEDWNHKIKLLTSRQPFEQKKVGNV